MKVSPAEHHPTLSTLGGVSSVPERFGADFLWVANGLKWGVQRKEVKDLAASHADGRLTREVGMMKKLDRPVVIVEGKLHWSTDGVLLTAGKGASGFGREWTYDMWLGVVAGLQDEGVWVLRADDVVETARMLTGLERWSRKTKHSSLVGREPLTSVWGQPTNHEFATYMLTGLPGVGPELAARVVEKFDGLPWRWTIGEDELQQVPGIGAKKARSMVARLHVKGEGWL